MKNTPYRQFVGVDAGFNTLIRPAMYGSYHPVVVANRLDEAVVETYDIAGPICESGDFLAKERTMPVLKPGELVAVMSAGAYGFTMSSNYNSRPRIPEVLASGTKFYVIRERETYEDLVRGERIPEFLNQ